MIARMPAERPPVLPPRVGRLAMIARWKPVHVGHAAVLEALVARADRVVIGIGSSNRYNARNPFTVEETQAMIRAVLRDAPGYEVIAVPDLDDGPRWRAMVVDRLGPLDLFVTANAYVKSLLDRDYTVVHPVHFVPEERRVRATGTATRLAMATGDDWRALVPPAVAALLDEGRLVERFRREFGAETIGMAAAERAWD